MSDWSSDVCSSDLWYGEQGNFAPLEEFVGVNLLRPVLGHLHKGAAGQLVAYVDAHDLLQKLRESISPTIHRLAPSTRNGPAALALMPEPFYSRSVPDPTYLSSQLLLALPGIGDPRFERAVIAMCVHDENGAFGIGI